MALEWSLKLKDGMSWPTQNAAAALAVLEKRLKGVRGSSELFSKRFDKAPPKFSKWAESLGQMFGPKWAKGMQSVQDALGKNIFGNITGADALKGIASAGATLGAAFVAAFAVAAGAVVGVVANIAGQIAGFQQQKGKQLFAFDKLLGPGGGARAWDVIRAAAEKTKTTLAETAASINSLVASGFSLPQADTLYRQMADLKALNPQANIDGIVRAIGQIRNTGKLQGDELMQLAEAGVNVGDVYDEIGKKLGKTRDEVMKLQSAGKITADTAIEAIQKAIAKKTGGDPGAVAGGAPKSAAESWDRLRQKFFDMVNVDFGPFTRFLDKLETALDGEGGKKLAASFERLFGAAGKMLDSISVETLTGALTAAAGIVDDIATAMELAAAAADKLDGAMRFVDGVRGKQGGSTAGEITGGMLTMVADALTGGLWSTVKLSISQWDLITEIGAKLAEAAAGLSAQAGTWYDSAISLGSSLIDGILAGITEKAQALYAKLAELGQAARDAFGAAIGEGSPARLFFPAGRSIAEGVGVGVDQGSGTLATAIDGLAAVAQARMSGETVGRSLQTTNVRGGDRNATINVTQNDPQQLGQLIRQIVRQENRLAAT